MTFPFYLNLLGLRLHPHPVFEGLGYFTAARVYFAACRRAPASLPLEKNLWLLVGCVFGAWAGSKILAWAEMPHYYLALARGDPTGLLGGKTIVGGLLGGWAGIEIAKRQLGIVQSTGDTFVWPLALGTAIGRLGCFFTGLSDHTYGIATSLPWGVDFGDGIRRHPTQLYESGFVLVLALAISRATRGRLLPSGARFRLYFAGYFGFRFLVEFIKPRETPFAGLSAIQLASAAGLGLALFSRGRPAASLKKLAGVLMAAALLGGCATDEYFTERPVANQIPALKAGVYSLQAVDVRPVATKEIEPDFPPELGSVLTGGALVVFTVRADGKVADASVVQADDVLFGEAAVAAVSKWRFHPALLKGAPVDCRMTLPFVFDSPYGYDPGDGLTPKPSQGPPPDSPPKTSIETH